MIILHWDFNESVTVLEELNSGKYLCYWTLLDERFEEEMSQFRVSQSFVGKPIIFRLFVDKDYAKN